MCPQIPKSVTGPTKAGGHFVIWGLQDKITECILKYLRATDTSSIWLSGMASVCYRYYMMTQPRQGGMHFKWRTEELKVSGHFLFYRCGTRCIQAGREVINHVCSCVLITLFSFSSTSTWPRGTKKSSFYTIIHWHMKNLNKVFNSISFISMNNNNKLLYLMQSHYQSLRCECWDRFFDGGVILHPRLSNNWTRECVLVFDSNKL